MVYRKTKQKVRRIYSRSKTIFGGDLLKNPFILGIAAGVAKNALSGKKIIDIENIKSRISKMDGTNPLILLGLGIATRNPLITAISLFGIVDPPEEEKKEEYIGYSNLGENEEIQEYSNVGETQESTGYLNVGENEKITPKRRCVF